MASTVAAFCAPAALPRLAAAAPRSVCRRRQPRAAAGDDESGKPGDERADTPPGSSPGQQRAQPKRATRKQSIFEATIDDLTMKRMGRGSMYYGKRADPDEETASGPLIFEPKADPVVVAGATGRTGQWVSLGLLAQGFNVRAITRAPRRAEKLFGPAGANVDVATADVTRPDSLPAALEGATALSVCVSSPRWLPASVDKVESEGLVALVRAAADVDSIRRVVLIVAADRGSPRARAAAVEALQASGKPYAVLRVGELNDMAGGEREIELRAAAGAGEGGGGGGGVADGAKLGSVSRVDLAQVVCQALVHDRSMKELQERDPDGEFDFPSCIIDVQNGPNAHVPNRRFWRSAFNGIAAAFREETPVDDDADAGTDVVVQDDAQGGASA